MAKAGARRGLLPIVLTALVACHDPIPPPDVTVTDSAGIEIVTNRGVVRGPGALRLSRDPVLRTGWEDEEPWFQAVTSAQRLEDGRLVVTDRTAGKLSILAPDGVVLTEVGGRGEGEGEFQGLARVFVGGDSLYAYDEGSWRITVIAEGRARRHLTLGDGRAGYAPVARLADGGYVLHRYAWSLERGGGATWDDAPVIRVAADGSPLDTFALGEPGLGPPADRFTVFHAWTQVAGGNRTLVYNRMDLPSLRVHDTDGALRRIVRFDLEPTALDDRVWNEALESFRGTRDRTDEELRRARDEAPSHLPLFNRLHMDARGAVWLGEYAVPPRPPARYFVISPEGRWLGAVTMPEGFELLHVGAEEVIGVQTDAAGVQALAVFAVEGS